MPRHIVTLAVAIVITAIVVGSASTLAMQTLFPGVTTTVTTIVQSQPTVTTSNSTAQVTIKFGALGPYASDTLVQAAVQMGFFQKYNLNVQVTQLRVSGTVVQALAGGSIDIGHASTLVVLQSAEKGVYLPMLLPVSDDGKNPLTNIEYSQVGIALANNINSIQDLKGKTVATAGPGSTDIYAMEKVLEQAGLNPSTDVHMVTIPPGSAMVSALASGEIQAFLTSKLYVQAAVNQGIGKDSGVNPGVVFYNATWFPWTVIAVNPSFLASNPDAVHRFAKALSDAAQWIMIYRNQWKTQVLAPYTGVNASILLQMPDTWNVYFTPYPNGWTDGLPVLNTMVSAVKPLGLLNGTVSTTKILTLPWFTPSSS